MSKFIGRNKHNQICIDSLRLQVWLDDLFMECKTEKEIDFILENIVGYAEKCAEEARELTIEEVEIYFKTIKYPSGDGLYMWFGI